MPQTTLPSHTRPTTTPPVVDHPAAVPPAAILIRGAPELEQVASAVEQFDAVLLQQIAQLDAALLDYRRRSGFGRAIAAPQIGLSVRLIVLNLGAGPIAIINPEITWRSAEMQWVWDDCLSVPDQIVRVQRHRSISLRYHDAQGRERHWRRLPADLAELLQHEIDHLDGILMTAHAADAAALRPLAERAALVGAARPQRRLQAAHVIAAAAQIHPAFLHSPQFLSEPLSELLGCHLMVKLETLNPLRSFKGRGASYLLAELARTEREPQLVAASAGNWGQALAYECRRRDWPLKVFAAHSANPIKLERMRALGATVILAGDDFDAAKAAAKDYAQKHAARFLEDGLEAAVSEGHGTIARELLQDGTAYAAIIAPLGNGALLNGIACWAKAADPAVAIIGVCAQGAPSMRDSWLQGRFVESTQVDTIADGIAVRVPIAAAVADMQGMVDEVVLVSDAQLIEAMRLAHEHLGVVLEPAGAAALAAVIAQRELFAGQHLAVVLGGSYLNRSQMQQYLSYHDA